MSEKTSGTQRLVDEFATVERRRRNTEDTMLDPSVPEDVRHECALKLSSIDERRAALLAKLWALGIDVGTETTSARSEEEVAQPAKSNVIDLASWRSASGS